MESTPCQVDNRQRDNPYSRPEMSVTTLSALLSPCRNEGHQGYFASEGGTPVMLIS